MRTYQPTDITDEEATEFSKESTLRYFDQTYELCQERGCFLQGRRGMKGCHKAPECFLLDAAELVELSRNPRNKAKILQEGLELAPFLADTYRFYGEPWKLKFTAALEANGVPQRVINEVLEAIAEEYSVNIADAKEDLAWIKSDPDKYISEAGLTELPDYLAKLVHRERA
jgi:hypothetical protein